jgi:peptidoglycan hydrolase-like protein with peptidoglycan-binding domain
MGNNAESLGNHDVATLLVTAQKGVSGQLDMMMRFIRTRKLIDALNGQDWRKVARTYNGEDYAKNNYDTKLAAGYAQWSQYLKDHGGAVPIAGPISITIEVGSRGERVMALQLALQGRGYPCDADGIYGTQTRDAVMAFQRDAKLPATGTADEATLNALKGAPTPDVVRPDTRPQKDLIAALLEQLSKAAPSQAPAGPVEPVLSTTDKVLGGEAMVGSKTLAGVLAYVVLAILQSNDVIGPTLGDKATTTAQVLTTLIAAYTGLGVTAKADRITQLLALIAKK